MPTLALLDGNSIAYRAFFALPPDLATTSGQVTNAAYGFTRMLIKLLGDHHPDAVAVAWDVSRQTFRSAEYPEYKAQREAAPDAFKSQLPLINEVLDSLGVAQLRMDGYEADDLIASIGEMARTAAWNVLLVTGDRDAFQLIDDHLKVLYTRRGITDVIVADEGYVFERYGINPDQYVDYAALRGDTSDNLPGVPGVGEKTASKLIADYASLEGIYDHLDDLTPRLRQNLAEHRDQAFLNRKLMTLVRDLDLDLDLARLQLGEWDRTAAKQTFESLEFFSLWEDLLEVRPASGVAVQQATLDTETRLIEAPAEIGRLGSGGRLVLDLIDSNGLWGLAVFTGESEAVAIPLDAFTSLAAILADPAIAKVAHDGKDLIRRLLDAGYELAGLDFDTALASYLLNPATREYDLASIATKYLKLELESPDQGEPIGKQGTLDFSSGPDLDAAGRRVEAVAQLAERLEAELEARDEVDLFRRFELPLVPVLARMEHAGIGVDRTYLEEMGSDLRSRLSELERRIHQEAGDPFNVNSTNQLREVLYEKLKLPVLKKTSTGAPSTDASVLEKLAESHPIVQHLLNYRELEKLRSTYVDGYLPLITTEGRIHTSFNQMAATTGRLSSDTPNLQNIPVRSDTGKTVRRAFIPRDGWTFLVADYSQIELRVLAHMSHDPGLVEAFATEADIHTATASRVFSVPLDQVTTEMRRRAKTINFGLLYGMEAFGLADRLGITRDEARHHIDEYFAQFPDVKAFMDGVVTQARNQGYTTTLFGRRRYLPELKSDNFRIRQMGERMALNAPVQGTAADIIKRAMIDLDAEMSRRELASSMLLQIHDELILESPVDELEAATELVTRVMEDVVELAVPLRVDVSTGPNLAELKRIT
ncbi:MAG TPA: DNA polymerase I [Acidimicrobiia bacterium]|nr:DNA polymerase I [Acidimicrobiia bacterium]